MGETRASGVRLEYSDTGTGDLPLLCLTGWCSSSARFDRFIPVAANRRRVVAFDWRGHGASDAASGDFGVAEQVEDALAVIEAAGLDRFVPVSASHSGWVAIELRRRLGSRIPKIVHMDWLMIEPSARYMDVIRLLQSTERWPEARDTLFRIWKNGVERPEIDSVIEVMNRQGAEMWIRSAREIEESFARNGCPFDALLQLPSQPGVLHVYGQPLDDAYLEQQQQFAREHPWFEVCRLGGLTHFSMTESPDEAVAAIEAFIG